MLDQVAHHIPHILVQSALHRTELLVYCIKLTPLVFHGTFLSLTHTHQFIIDILKLLTDLAFELLPKSLFTLNPFADLILESFLKGRIRLTYGYGSFCLCIPSKGVRLFTFKVKLTLVIPTIVKSALPGKLLLCFTRQTLSGGVLSLTLRIPLRRIPCTPPMLETLSGVSLTSTRTGTVSVINHVQLIVYRRDA